MAKRVWNTLVIASFVCLILVLINVCFFYETSSFQNGSGKHVHSARSAESVAKKKLMEFQTREPSFKTRTQLSKASSTSTASIKKNLNSNCTLWRFPSEVDTDRTPRLQLDPNRFLYPGLIWGPNNQIKGLQQAVYLAIKLNRTLVLPVFHAHDTDPGVLPPFQAIDVERLCDFVSCISLESLQKRCNGSFDVAFQSSPSLLGHLKTFERETSMNIYQPKSISDISFPSKINVVQNRDIPKIPTLPNLNFTSQFGHNFPTDEHLKAAFNTTARCAIAVSLFKWIDVYPNEGVARSLTKDASLSSIPNSVLYSAVIDSIRHPPCVVSSALEYINEAFSNRKYIGVHWRYDEKDFGRICKEPWAKATFYCKNAFKIQPKVLAFAIYNATDTSTTDSIPVYIASPPSLETFVNKVYEELEKLSEKLIKPSVKLTDFMSAKYSSCWNENKWITKGNIFSLCEMEIMINSFWFFFSTGSTWSEMIRPLRTDKNKTGSTVLRYEKSVLDVAVAAMA